MTCRGKFQTVASGRELLLRQTKIQSKYQALGEAHMMARLKADESDVNVPEPLRKVAAKLIRNYQSKPKLSYEEYDKFAKLFSQYLQVRFFSHKVLETPQENLNLIRRYQRAEADIQEKPHEKMPIKLIQFPGVASFEQISEMRAYGLSPIGTIEKVETIDGTPGYDLQRFRRHDDSHFTGWINQLDHHQRFYNWDLVELFLKTSSYFEKLVEKLNHESPEKIQVRRVVFFLYFYVSHERNIDVVSSQRWIKHLLTGLDWNARRLDEAILMEKIEKESLQTLFPKSYEGIVNELATQFGWPWGRIYHRDLIAALRLIRSVESDTGLSDP